ncbi:ABATE domain-containing protein [Streptomyces sp. NPDC000410]|uniref:CGNR zinc finger domain-containing protein n=1 Tax=Streptomyces sp. NPDC000410 TaxID=3154254 RepID=UPI0033188E3E
MGDRTNQECGVRAVDQLPLSGEPLPLDLVNTTYIKGGVRGHLVDALTCPEELDQWLQAHRERFSPALASALGPAGPAGAAHLEASLVLRHALRELAAARTSGRAPEPVHGAVVNATARLAAQWWELSPGASFEAVPRWLESDPLRAALGEIAAAAVGLFAGEQGDRIRACAAPGCILYFVKSHARREWCTAGCGNRVRVARHSRRVRGDGAADTDTGTGTRAGAGTCTD